MVVYRIGVICSGNICRSPMLEFLLREALDDAGLGERVAVDSAGTFSSEQGAAADPRTLAVLRRQGHRDWGGAAHRARQLDRQWLAERDLILAADASHVRQLFRLVGAAGLRDKLFRIREFDPDAVAAGELDVDDPWYGDEGSFSRTYAELTAAVPGILEHVRRARLLV